MAAAVPLSLGQTLIAPLFNEPMRVETVAPAGDGSWVVGLVGMQSERFRRSTLTRGDLEGRTILASWRTYDGDGHLLRLGLRRYSLGLAYEFAPYFALSISHVGPLPHQREYERAPDRKLPTLAGGYPRCSTDRETAQAHALESVTAGHLFFEAARRHTYTQVLDGLLTVPKG